MTYDEAEELISEHTDYGGHVDVPALAVALSSKDGIADTAGTLEKLAESNRNLRAEIEKYQAVCGAAYQCIGAFDGPVRFLDALSNAANGNPADTDTSLALLPVIADTEGAIHADCDVRKILLRVSPGDGDGHEEYARNVGDVEALLSKMGSNLEEFELGIASPAIDAAPVAAWISPSALLDVQTYGHAFVKIYRNRDDVSYIPLIKGSK